MENILTVPQIAEKLHVSVLTVRRYIKKKRLSASKIGKQYRVLESDLADFMNKNKV